MFLKVMSAQVYGDPTLTRSISTIRYQEHTATGELIGGRFVPVPYTFLQAGNALFSLFAACVGGIAARILAARQAPPRRGESARSAASEGGTCREDHPSVVNR